MIPGLASAIGAGGTPIYVEYLGKFEYASGSDMTGNVDIGAADTSKEIFVVMSVTYSIPHTFTAGSSTVDGQTVTKFTTDLTSTDARQVGCFVALPTQNGSVAFTMTFSGPLGSGVAFVYKVLRRPVIGAQHTDASGNSDTNNNIVVSGTTIPDGGIWFATGIKNNTNVASWNNGTIDDQENNLLSNRAWCAHRDQQTVGSTPSDNFSWSGSDLCSAAAWAFS